MEKQKFSRREVERSFRKFKDIVSDLMQARFQTWGDTFTHLITHCEQDPVMCVVTESLRANPKIDVNKWYADCIALWRGTSETARYMLPTDDDERTALLYQFFLKVENENLDLIDFCSAVWQISEYQEMVRAMNCELIVKFAREVTYRLDEIIEDIGSEKEVPREAMLVFHYHDNSLQDLSMNIHGNVQGSNIAGGGSIITESAASFNSQAELGDALKSLKPLIHEVAANQKEAIEQAMQVLIDATKKDVPMAQVAPSLAMVAQASPTLGQRLKDIGGKIGIGLVNWGISQAIKSYFGIT